MDDVITLVKEEYRGDSIGQQIPEEKKREVFCDVGSVTRAEWRAAGQNSIKASLMVKTASINYLGERVAIFHGERKEIYRTFHEESSDSIELYLRDEAGELGEKL